MATEARPSISLTALTDDADFVEHLEAMDKDVGYWAQRVDPTVRRNGYSMVAKANVACVKLYR